MADDEYGPISDEEKLKIVSHFLLSAPPGEINEVLADVKELVQNDALVDKALPNVFRSYNTENFATVKSGDHDVILCKAGEVDSTHYLDPRNKKVLTVDHVAKTATAEDSPSSFPSDVEGVRSAVQTACDKYVATKYKDGVVSVFAKKDGGSTVVTIAVSALRANLYNFWSGRWRSRWVVTIDGESAKVEGTLRVNVHYFEDGNVQLNSSVDRTGTAKGDSDDNMAASIIKCIEASEDEYQKSLEESYSEMSDTAFKALRRKLPVNMKRYDFSGAYGHKLAAELNAKK
eukprot:GFYU01001169.1.p1 GENE.GFYU01001169.1~~GFYU01001169.1.p1  ORF type:complete len:288 (+),score=72.50 GFYU01001169.1:123-986(+)